MTVAIDGPAGSGKSSVARCVAERAGLFYLNSGLFYRAITWAAVQRNVSLTDPEAVGAIAKGLQMVPVADGLLVDGVLCNTELRSPAIDSGVPSLSAVREVREVVNARLREVARERDLVAEGRDMTTVVFPDAEVKAYLDASLEARAERRLREQNGTSMEEMVRRIAERDRIDREKEFGPLIRSPEALYIDTSHLTLEQVCDTLLRAIHST